MATYVGSGKTIVSTASQSSYVTGTDGGSSYTVGSGADRVLLIWLIGYTDLSGGTKGASAVSHNGEAATRYAVTPSYIRSWVECWYIKSPAAGAGGTSVTCNATQRAFQVFVEEWSDVDQTTPIHATSDSYGGSAATKTFSLTTNGANSALSAAISVQSNAGTWSASDGGTLRQSGNTGTTGFNDNSGGLASEEVPSAGAQSLTLSWTSSNESAGLMVELLDATGGGTSVTLDALAYTVALPDLTVAVNTPVGLDALSYTATLPDVSVAVDTPVALDAIAYTVTLPDVDVGVSALVAMDSLSYAATLPDVTISTGTPVALDALAYTVALPDASVTVDTPVALDSLGYAAALNDLAVSTSVTVSLDALDYAATLPEVAVQTASRARGDDAFRSSGAREEFWRRKAEEWLDEHLQRVQSAAGEGRSARKRAARRIVEAAERALVEMPQIAPRIDMIAAFARQLAEERPDFTALAAAVAAQMAQVEAEKRARRRKRDLEAVLLLAA